MLDKYIKPLEDGGHQSDAFMEYWYATSLQEDEFADQLEKADDFQAALQALLRDTFRTHRRIIFNGNGYGEAWMKEAEQRGLSNFRNAVDALPSYIDPINVALFSRHGILTSSEMQARYEIHLENYCKVTAIEANTLLDMTRRSILPAVSRYADYLSQAVFHRTNCGMPVSGKMEQATLRQITTLNDKLFSITHALERAVAKAPDIDAGIRSARYYRDEIAARVAKAGELINQLESITAADFWPYPTYADILFSV